MKSLFGGFCIKSFVLIIAVFVSLGVSAQNTYELVNDASTLSAGNEVIIVAKDYNFALSTTQNTNNRGQTAVTKSGSTIEIPDNNTTVQILTLETGHSSTTGTFAFNTGSGYLYAASSSSNHLKTKTTLDAEGSWTISITSDGVATIKAQGDNTRNWMRYNSTNKLFSCYGSGQADICIYKNTSSTTPTPSTQYTVTWNVNGTTSTSSVLENSVPVANDIPSTSADCDGEKIFVGWTTSPIASPTDIAPATLYSNAQITEIPITENTTYYAVFATATGTSETWNLVTDASTLAVGDVVVIAANTKSKVAGTLNSTYLNTVNVAFSGTNNSILTFLPNADPALQFTLGESSGAWTLANSSSQLLKSDATKSVGWENGTSTWTININSNNATITNTTSSYGSIQYNHSSPRFTTYTSTQTAVQLYRKTGGVSYSGYSTSCEPISCPAPTSLVVNESGISQNSATISWTAGGSERSWEYYYSTENTAPTEETSGTVVTTNSTELPGLSANTTYYWWIRAVCGDDDKSYWVAGSSFTTLNYTVTVQSNDESLGTVSIEDLVITATPNDCVEYAEQAFTITSGTADVLQNGNTFTVTPTSNCEITINFATSPRYTITWSVNGTETTSPEYCEGSTPDSDDIPTPTSADCDEEKVFVGWSTSEISEPTNDEPTLLSNVQIATTPVNSNVTYYAVFAYDVSETWNLITDASTLAVGDVVVIAAKEDDFALSTNQKTNNRGQTAITKSGNTITNPSADVQQLTLAEGGTVNNNHTFAFYTGSGYLYAASGSDNQLKTQTTLNDNGRWIININGDGTATIEAQGSNSHNVMRYNDGSGLFSCYSSASQKDICLYRKTTGYQYPSYSTTCVSCATLPEISSSVTASDVTAESAKFTSPGISSIGDNCEIHAYGFVYSETADPTIENGNVINIETSYTTLNESFETTASELLPCTEYYVRAFVTNGFGTVYSDNERFTTSADSKITGLSAVCYTNTSAIVSISYSDCLEENGTYVIAIREGANPPTSLGTTSVANITANTTFGSGYSFGNSEPYSYVVYKTENIEQNLSQITITNLTPGSTYKLKAYKWLSATNKWSTDGTTCTLTMPQIVNASYMNNEESAIVSWSINKPICNGKYVVVCKEGDDETFATTCTNFSNSMIADSTFGDGTQTSTGEYLVHNGEETNVAISGLTGGETYSVAIFYVDDNGNCSSPETLTFTFSTTTILQPGDLAIIAINNNFYENINGTSASAEEISFVVFRDILPGTHFDITDNGYERGYPERWGMGEGFFRLKRKTTAKPVPQGSVITIFETKANMGIYIEGFVFRVNIYVNGLQDNINWEVQLADEGNLDLNYQDQLWFMQGGEWLFDENYNDHNAYYTGNVLYGFTATGWKEDVGFGLDEDSNGSHGSRLFPGRECFTTTLNINNSESGRVKYDGPLSAATRTEWIMRINDESNWAVWDYDSPRNYRDQDIPDANLTDITYPLVISPGELSKGVWSGNYNDDWCNCRNWLSLIVPDETTDVRIPDVNSRHEVAIYENDTAKCKNLTIDDGGYFRNVHDNSTLKVAKNILIEADGTFRPKVDSTFEIILGGDIIREGVFITNKSVSLTLTSNTSQIIDKQSSGDFVLNNLKLSASENQFVSDSIILYGNLTDNSPAHNGFYLPENPTLTLTFTGSNQQTSTATQIGNFVIDKESENLTLSGELSVSDTAKFIKGIVTGNVSFGADGLTENANIDSYVDGIVKKKAADKAFIFPTGNNEVLGKMEVASLSSDVSLRFNHNPNGFEVGEMPVWWNQNNICSSDNGRFDHVSNMEFWKITMDAEINNATFTSTANSDVHFNMNTEDRNAENIQMAVYYDCWENVGGSATVSETYNEISVSEVNIPLTRETRAVVERFVTFGSKSNTTLLPIELIDFHADCNGNSAEIYWSTATETNNDYFVLEKSANAINFTEVAQIAGAGNSIEMQNYSYTDNNLISGNTYYRLRQTDFDGTENISEIIVVNCKTEENSDELKLSVYPNPFGSEFSLILENFAGETNVEIFDMLGKLVYTKQFNIGNDYFDTKINIDLPATTYNLRVTSGVEVANVKVVRQ